MEKELTTLPPEARAAVALSSSQTEIDLRALAIKNVTITQVIDKAGRSQAQGAAMELRTARTDIEKVSKAARDDATKFSKAVIQEEKRLIGIIEPEELRLLGLRDKYDDIQLLIKQEAEARERARITAIHQRIADIRNFSAMAAQCRTSARVAELLVKLQAFDLEGFEEFSEEAATVHAATVSGVTFVHDEKVAEEAERARVKAKQEADAAALALAQAEQAAAATQLAADRAALEKDRAKLASALAALVSHEVKSSHVVDQKQADSMDKIGTVEVVAPIVVTHESVTNVVTMTDRIPAPATPPTLKLGQIAERLGFNLTADFLKGLGFDPAATDRASKLYHERDFTNICAALIHHINNVKFAMAITQAA